MALKQKPLSEIIASEIRHRIWSGEIEFGERLIESILAEEFDVSRSSLREALQILEFEGVVQNKARKGTFVVDFSEKDMHEITEVRAILETTAFNNAMNRLNSEDFNHLRELIESMKENIQKENWMTIFDLDMEFHMYVVNRCDNSRIKKLYDIIQVQIRTLMSRLTPYYEENPDLFYVEHMELIEVLESKDQTLVEETVMKHVLDTSRSIADMFKEKVRG